MRQFVCPHCAAANRVPDEKDAGAAKCGRCHDRLFEGRPLEVDAATLETHKRQTKGAALLLDVWAPWCGPCKAMAPQFAAAAARLEPKVRLLKLNSDENQAAAAALGVQGIPALFLIKDGQVVARHAGAIGAREIVAFAEQNLAAKAA